MELILQNESVQWKDAVMKLSFLNENGLSKRELKELKAIDLRNEDKPDQEKKEK